MAVWPQGSCWSVLADMLRELAIYLGSRGWPRWSRVRRRMDLAGRRARCLALAGDAGLSPEENPFYGNYTTGFGVVAVKK